MIEREVRTEDFIAEIDRCMRAMKECAWQWQMRQGDGPWYLNERKPLPKRGEDAWLDMCCKRACE